MASDANEPGCFSPGSFFVTVMLDPADRLRKAIVSGNLAITKRLLARFPELWLNTDPTNHGWCNLHYASYHGHYLVCFHLVSVMHRMKKYASEEMSLCDLDLVTFDDLTVLHMPVLHHHSQTLHFLLQEFSGDSWLNFKGGPLSRTPLHYCCVSRFVDGLQLLLEFGADWMLTDANGDTCLHLCFAYGDLACIEALLKFIMGHALQTRPGEDSPKKSSLRSDNGASADLRGFLNCVVSKYEGLANNSGQLALSYAVSFEMERRYHVSKKQWIDRIVDDEVSLKSTPQWDAASSMFEFGDRRAPFSSPGLSSLANYGNIASVSRTSFDSDLLEASSTNTEPHTSGGSSRGPVSRDKIEAAEAENSGTSADEESKWKGRKHSRSLPSSADSESAPEPGKPARQHAKSFAFNFRGSPLMTRSSVSQSSSTFPISPLQVEFTSTQSRKSSLVPSMRSPQKTDLDSAISAQIVEGTGTASKLSGIVTPTSGSFVNSLTFSPLSTTRRKSISASSALADTPEKDAKEYVRERGPLSRFPSTGTLRQSSESLRRNFSTPAKLANIFHTADSPTKTLRQNRVRGDSTMSHKTSPSKISPYKPSSAKSVASYDGIEGSPLIRLESQDDAEKKFVFSFAQPPRSPQHASLPNLRVKSQEGKEEDTPPRNVRSISFARVREE